MKNIQEIITKYNTETNNKKIESKNKILKTGIKNLDGLFTTGCLTSINESTWISHHNRKNTFVFNSLSKKTNKKCLLIHNDHYEEDIAKYLIDIQNTGINKCSSTLYLDLEDNFDGIFEVIKNLDDFSAVMILDFDSYRLDKHFPDTEDQAYILKQFRKLAEQKQMSITVCTSTRYPIDSLLRTYSQCYMEWYELEIDNKMYNCALFPACLPCPQLMFFYDDDFNFKNINFSA